MALRKLISREVRQQELGRLDSLRAYFARAAAALAASVANFSRPKAVPESPQPPSVASVRMTQVRLACVGSPETLVTISVISLTSCFWPPRFNAAGGVMTWTRTVRAELVAAVRTACGSMRWMKAAVLFKWKGPGVATPSARRTAMVSSLPSRPSVPAGNRSAGAYTSIIGIVTPPKGRVGFRSLAAGHVSSSLTGLKLIAPLASPLPSPARRSQSEEKPEIRPRSELNSGCAELALNLEGSGPAGI